MRELIDKHWPVIRALILPYLVFLFLLSWPIEYQITSPGGLAEVGKTIVIDYQPDKEVEGSFSTTYVMYVSRSTTFEFLVGYFSRYSDLSAVVPSDYTYTPSEEVTIAYLDRAQSVDASIIVAYEKMHEINPEIRIAYDVKAMVWGKTNYLSAYETIDFGDEFVQLVADGGLVITEADYLSTPGIIATNTTAGTSYAWTFRNEEGEEYVVDVVKNADKNAFGLTLKTYYVVDEENTWPAFRELGSLIGGPSGGLLQTLYVYNCLSETDITHGLKIAGTGTIAYNGTAGDIGGVKQKIATAYVFGVDLFFIDHHSMDNPYDDYVEALAACEELGIEDTSWIIPVASFQDCLDYLDGLGD